MKKRLTSLFIAALASASLLACGAQAETTTDVVAEDTTDVVADEAVDAEESAETQTDEDATDEAGNEPFVAPIEDGVYIADFDTDSSMFHVNETCDGKGMLVVQDGAMTIHITLTSQNIVNLYEGLAEDAQAEGAVLLQPTLDTVIYDDGLSEEVNGFDVAVPYLDDEFDLALIGTKGIWYDHKVSVSNPVPFDEASEGTEVVEADEPSDEAGEAVTLEDGTYVMEVTMEGGSGRASIDTPTEVYVENGQITALIVWSSANYDYMLVGDEKFDVTMLTKEDGNEYSSFVIPVEALDQNITVIGDTTAMSTPHEVEYTLYFDSTTISE